MRLPRRTTTVRNRLKGHTLWGYEEEITQMLEAHWHDVRQFTSFLQLEDCEWWASFCKKVNLDPRYAARVVLYDILRNGAASLR